MFGLRRLRGNPPCSLWLQSVHWTNCFTRRARITVPPCKGTHGDRVAGDNTRSRHNQRHFSHCATSLCAPAPQQHGAVACTLRQVRRSIRSPPCGSKSVFEVTHSVYKYAPNRLSVCGKRAVLRKSHRCGDDIARLAQQRKPHLTYCVANRAENLCYQSIHG